MNVCPKNQETVAQDMGDLAQNLTLLILQTGLTSLSASTFFWPLEGETTKLESFLSSQYKGMVPLRETPTCVVRNIRRGRRRCQGIWLSSPQVSGLRCHYFSPVRDGDLEARFMREHRKGEIVDILQNHTDDAEFEHHRKRLRAEGVRPAS